VDGVTPCRPEACRGAEREDPCCEPMSHDEISLAWEDRYEDVPSPKCGTTTKDGRILRV
jgi:hypothetical protein